MQKLYSIRAKKRIEKIERRKDSNNEVLDVTYGDETKRIKVLKHKPVKKKVKKSVKK